jgi:hypothetical protein
MTLPEQSDRAVAQTREFLVRLASPYGEGGIKGIRREIRAEALALLRHYPYVETDEKRCVDDMTGASDIVTRLRNWREVHLARLHLLMEEAADEMERLRQVLSQKNHYPDLDNAAKRDILTDAEREAVTTAMNAYAADNADEECAKIEATLSGLLERL